MRFAANLATRRSSTALVVSSASSAGISVPSLLTFHAALVVGFAPHSGGHDTKENDGDEKDPERPEQEVPQPGMRCQDVRHRSTAHR
jgi:hypothetical protein